MWTQVETATGEVRSRYSILNDFVHVAHANGVFLLEDMVCILAVKPLPTFLFNLRKQCRFRPLNHCILGENTRQKDWRLSCVRPLNSV